MRRARQLWLGGLAGGHLLWLTMLGFAILSAGVPGLVTALISGAVVIGFFAIGGAILAAVADWPPISVLVVALASYVLRVVGAGILLWQALANAERLNLQPGIVIATTIAVVLGWVSAEVWAFTRLRIPVFDSTEQ